jgi:hypothetical protein
MSIIDTKNIVVNLASDKYFYGLVQQLIKDFNDEDFEQRISELRAGQTDEVLEEVSFYLSILSSRSIESFSQLMYVIDMPEKILAPFLSAGQHGWKDFTFQVIKREYLKVLIREKYSD